MNSTVNDKMQNWKKKPKKNERRYLVELLLWQSELASH